MLMTDCIGQLCSKIGKMGLVLEIRSISEKVPKKALYTIF
jgi:hypothetical protein